MTGVICKKEVCSHPIVTIRCFGWKLFWHVLFASPNQTFLDLVAIHCQMTPPQVNVAKVIDRCIKLEQRANHLYYYLSLRMQHKKDLCIFLQNLADQEQEHAEILEICRKLSGRKHTQYARFAQWENTLPILEQTMDDIELQSEHIETEHEVLQLVISIEGSEINSLFTGVINSANSAFLQNLQTFQLAEQKHIDYICNHIPQMVPELAGDCIKLQNGELH